MAEIINDDYVGDVLNLAMRGYRVFPVSRRTKIPIIKQWQHKATDDPLLIEAWWAASPDAIPGVLCGDGLLVVDIDDKAQWNEEFPYAPVETPSGGYHVYYKSDECPTTASKLGKGIDTRGTGGFVVAWEPEKIPNKDYLPEIPHHIIRKLTSKDKEPASDTSIEIVGEGQRNASLTSFLGTLRAKGWSYDELLAAAMAYNERFCIPPDDSEQIEKTVLSISRYTPHYAKLVDRALLRLRATKDAKRIFENEQAGFDTFTGDPTISICTELPDEPRDLIDEILPSTGALGIIGETNTGKSLITLEICSALITGNPLWGRIYPNKKLTKITYVLGEHTSRVIVDLFKVAELPMTDKIRLIGPELLNAPPGRILVSNGIERELAVERLVRWTEGSELIVFDPVGAFIGGENAENDNTAMRAVVSTMQHIAEANKAACIVIGHTGKPAYDPYGGKITKTSYRTRGASATEDAFTHCHYISDKGNDNFEIFARKYKGQNTDKTKLLKRSGLKHSLIV